MGRCGLAVPRDQGARTYGGVAVPLGTDEAGPERTVVPPDERLFSQKADLLTATLDRVDGCMCACLVIVVFIYYVKFDDEFYSACSLMY